MARRLQNTTDTAAVSIAAAVTSLAFPPVSCGLVPSGWSSAGVVPEFDLEIRCAGAIDLMGAELFGGKLHAFIQADIAIDSVTHAADTFTEANHGLQTGDGPFRLTSSGALPTGLATLTDYWIVRVDANTIKFAASFVDAMAQTPVTVGFSTDGTGTHTLADTADTKRVYWYSYGLLTSVIPLTASRAYSRRCAHRPQTVAYAVAGTLSAATATTIQATPVAEN